MTHLKLLNALIEKKWMGISIFYLVGVVLIHAPLGSSMLDDSLEILLHFDKFGWSHFWQSFDFTSIYYFHDLVSILFYKLFGTNNRWWYYSILFIHTSSAYFLYRFFLHILLIQNPFAKNLVALILGLCFLFGAYHSENLSWIATYHYNISMLYLSMGLYYISSQKGQISKCGYSILLLLLPIFLTMHEISFFIPFAFLCVVLYFNFLNYKLDSTIIRKALRFVAPFIIIEILFLILTKMVKGHFIPHYGASHITNHTLYNFIVTLLNYCFKHLLFFHNYSFQIREKIYDIDPKTIYVFLGIVFIGLGYVFYKFRALYRSHLDVALLFALLILFFIPVSNMYFFWHFPIQNDRLGYFLSPFLYGILILVLVKFHTKLGLFFSFLFLVCNIIFLNINIKSIQDAIQFGEQKLYQSYMPYIDKSPYILNLPYNYKGFYIYRDHWRIVSYFEFRQKKKIKYQYVASMPFMNSTDSIQVQKLNDTTLYLSLKAPGSWFMKGTLGAEDYENDNVKVDFSDDNLFATVTLKRYDSISPILYCTGEKGFVQWK